MPSTYKDIQQLTGFSLSTISRYFNGENVRPGTKNAIENAVDQLDFKMNDFARGLRSRKSKTIGLLIPDLNRLFFTTLMYQLGMLLRERGYGCFVCDCNLDKNTEIEVMNFFINKSVDGVIIIPYDQNPVCLEAARARNIRTVLINNALPSFETDAVIIDNFEAGKMAAEYLLSKGHKKTAVISNYTYFHLISERQRGFLSPLLELGQDFCPHAIEKPSAINNGYQAVKELFTIPNDITALFCTSYELTLGAITALSELGIKFPADISFIGFDNLQLAQVIRPTLTLIEQPMEQIAYEAVRLLIRQLENDSSHKYETIVLNTKLVEGESVADIR